MQGSRFGKKNSKGGMMPRRRRKKIKQPPGHPSDEELIASYLQNAGKVTVCPPGHAIGSIHTTCHGLD